MRKISLNNRFIVEAYKKESLRSSEKNGFAMIAQKNTLKGLRLLVAVRMNDDTFFDVGSIVYVKEETLHTQQWAQKVMECETVGQPFLILDASHVEFVEYSV